MLQVLWEIILSILCVYGGYRLLHDAANLLEHRLQKRREGRSEQPDAAENGDEKDRKGGEDSDPGGK